MQVPVCCLWCNCYTWASYTRWSYPSCSSNDRDSSSSSLCLLPSLPRYHKQHSFITERYLPAQISWEEVLLKQSPGCTGAMEDHTLALQTWGDWGQLIPLQVTLTSGKILESDKFFFFNYKTKSDGKGCQVRHYNLRDSLSWCPICFHRVVFRHTWHSLNAGITPWLCLATYGT